MRSGVFSTSTSRRDATAYCERTNNEHRVVGAESRLDKLCCRPRSRNRITGCVASGTHREQHSDADCSGIERGPHRRNADERRPKSLQYAGEANPKTGTSQMERRIPLELEPRASSAQCWPRTRREERQQVLRAQRTRSTCSHTRVGCQAEERCNEEQRRPESCSTKENRSHTLQMSKGVRGEMQWSAIDRRKAVVPPFPRRLESSHVVCVPDRHADTEIGRALYARALRPAPRNLLPVGSRGLFRRRRWRRATNGLNTPTAKEPRNQSAATRQLQRDCARRGTSAARPSTTSASIT